MRAEQLELPPAYGAPSSLLPWETVDARLAAAAHYWLVTVRADGRPHAVPTDGLWDDGALFFSGDAATVHLRNLVERPYAAVHLDEAADSAVIVEGRADHVRADAALARSLNAASKAKYGYGPGPAAYRAGVWRLVPDRVLAWTVLFQDATRFVRM